MADPKGSEISDRALVGSLEIVPLGAELGNADVPGAQRPLDAGALLAEVSLGHRRRGLGAVLARKDGDPARPTLPGFELERIADGAAVDLSGVREQNLSQPP